MKVDRVLVPLDGSPFAELALPPALDMLTERAGATLILVRAAQARMSPGVDPTDAQMAAVGEAQAYVRSVADRLRDSGLSAVVITSVWCSGAAHAIVEAARLRRANLIMMSTRLGSVQRPATPGSVAEAVLRRTRTRVLLVRPTAAAGSCAAPAVSGAEPSRCAVNQ